MSSDEEDLELNEAPTPQLYATQEEDGAEENETEDGISVRNSPEPASTPIVPSEEVSSQEEKPANTPEKRSIDFHVRPETLTCRTYDCVPLVAAVHPSQIYSLATTRCFRWVFTGSEDGYVRKWDFFASMNGKTPLTQAQRHHHVDSVTMAGVMLSWWENEEPVSKPDQEGTASTTSGGTGTGTGAPTSSLVASTSISSNGSEAGSKLSPVYSMDVHSDALWALLGTESGGINLVTVRHDEGKCHHVLRSHTAPVSVLKITSDQTGVISGSWDKTVLEWDLNTGSVVRKFTGHTSQISSASFRPLHAPDEQHMWDEKDPNIFMTTSFDGQCILWDRREPSKNTRKIGLSDRSPPWCLSACWSTDGSKIYMGRRNGQVDEWDYNSQKLIRSFKMPANSGPVSNVACMPSGKHVVCASNDNVRLWNTTIESSLTLYPEGETKPPSSSAIPFTILPGHHGGSISHIAIDPTCRYMITTSGNRGWDGTSTNACLFYDIHPIA
ncbi:hypothetical protein VTP01DRAFT_10707 [Rhizomucor pusillus]|uniref:uncharacterized protein n=1 Tax=Rhizomucor pusillus TaxID=4840 RepID=UPI003743FBB1